MVKLSNFIIGIAICSFFLIVFGMMSTSLYERYGVDNTGLNFSSYSQLKPMDKLSGSLEGNVTDITQKTGTLDILGAWFSSGYQTMILGKDSFKYFDNMTSTAIEVTPQLNTIGPILKQLVMIIVVVLIVLGVIVSAFVKRDL